MLRATSFVRAQYLMEKPWKVVMLDAAARHLRRRLIDLRDGDEVLVDLPLTAKLGDRDCLILEDGRLLQIVASDEELLEVTAREAAHLAKLAWHIGNRHVEAQIETDRILIRRDAVIARMLEQLGATLREVCEPFLPEQGAYSHGH
jgi:urease accessory protein